MVILSHDLCALAHQSLHCVHEPKDRRVKVNKRSEPETKKEGKEEKDKKRKKIAEKRPEEQETKR